MLQLVAAQTPMLIVTLEYDQDKMQGPPFSVPVQEIRDYYQGRYHINILQCNEQINEKPRWRESGLESFRETALQMEAKP